MATYCNRCNTEVSFDDVSPDYYAVCPKHDEDLYKFETYEMDKHLTNRYSLYFRYEAGYDSHPAVLAYELYKDESGDWNISWHDIIDRYDFTDDEAEAFANSVGHAEEWLLTDERHLIDGWGLPQGALDMIANLKPYKYEDLSVVCVGTLTEEEQKWLDNAEESQRQAWLEEHTKNLGTNNSITDLTF